MAQLAPKLESSEGFNLSEVRCAPLASLTVGFSPSIGIGDGRLLPVNPADPTRSSSQLTPKSKKYDHSGVHCLIALSETVSATLALLLHFRVRN